MKDRRWARAKRLFETAVTLEPSKREAFLAWAVTDDPELVAEVRKMLAAESEAPSADAGAISRRPPTKD